MWGNVIDVDEASCFQWLSKKHSILNIESAHHTEMLKSLSLGACVVKTVACQHTSAHATPYKTEHVDFTQVL